MSARKELFVLFSAVFLPLNIAFAAGLQNPGFESGLDPWVATPADAVAVTGAEGAAESSTYADMGIEVTPYIGAKMVRLGSPKYINEKQVPGANSVTQTFSPDNDTLILSFRLFSWEHRGDDTFRIDVRDANGVSGYPIEGGLSITFPDGTTTDTCVATPCDFTIDVGKRGKFLDSDWMVVKVSGLLRTMTDLDPNVTVEYSVSGENNSAHATWAYFDNVNNPPVAKFSFTSDTITEGDPVTFTDESYDPDPGDSVVSWKWTVEGPLFDETIIVEDKNPIFVFPEQGQFLVTLTVTDTFGASTSVTSGEVTLDNVQIADFFTTNDGVLMSVLNQEVLAEQNVELFGRFIDPGFLDTHTGSWELDGSSIVADFQVGDPIPTIASGIVTGSAVTPAALGEITGTLNILDDDGATTSGDFVLRVLGSALNRHEPNNSISEAAELQSGWAYLSTIESADDVDIFEITGPDGVALAANGEVLVKLKNLPADYDLVLLSQLPVGVSTTPWTRSPWTRSPWTRSPWTRSPWTRSPWTRSPWTRSPWTRSPWTRSPWTRSPWTRSPWTRSCIDCDPFITFDQFPLSELAFVDSGSEDIGNGDIGVSELGLSSADLEGLTVVGFSSNRGLEDEELLIRTDFPGTRIFAMVVGANGMANPDEPYTLQVETSRPLDIEALLGDACIGSPVVTATGGAYTDQTSTVTSTYSGNPTTLIVTQTARMQALNGMDPTASAALDSKLLELANHSTVQGKIISLPSSIYDAWDSSPCSVEKANKVTEDIRGELAGILSSNTNIKYVVFVGNDYIVPHRRVPDETVISNERLYFQESFLAPGTPLFSSVYGGNNLTDDFYVDMVPAAWLGRHLYVPDYATGRLVETPDEIMSMIQNYISNDGVMPVSTALVSGYDFFDDGSAVTKGYLDQLLADTKDPTDMINETWDAATLRCKFLGEGGGAGCVAHDANSINAHFNHFGALTAYGFNTDNFDDFVSSTDVANAGNGIPVLENGLTFTLGCHAGLNVPDGSSLTEDFGLGVETDLDFAQAMARQKSMFIGSTGYGLGDDQGIAGTELLLALFAEELVGGGEVGTALRDAKDRYLAGLSTMSVYDEKSSIQTILYGLPMMSVAPSGSVSSSYPVDPYQLSSVAAGDVKLSVDGDGPTSHFMRKASTDSGEFYYSSGDHQATAWRPIQPRVVVDVTGTEPVHGLLFTGGAFYDVDPSDPVISRPTQEWEQNVTEKSVCVNAFWPSIPVTLNSEVGAETQTMIVTPGQFRCTSGQDPEVTGIQRIYTEMSVETIRSSSLDYNGPDISEVDFRSNDDGSLTINVDASDDSDISKIVILLIKNGEVLSTTYDSLVAVDGSYALNVANFINDTTVVIQVADGAGNVSTWSGKGVNVRIIEVDAGDSLLYSSLTPTTLRGTIPFFKDLLEKSPSMFYRWTFGDGSYAFGRLAKDGAAADGVVVSSDPGDRSATFTVEHQYATDYNITAELKVTDAFGGVGIDEVVLQACVDAVDQEGLYPDHDFVQCATSNNSTVVSIDLSVAGIIDDGIQYRIYLDINDDTGASVPDGKSDVMIKYQNGNATGLNSLVVTKTSASSLNYTFDLAELGWTGDRIKWKAQVQDGIAGQAGAGFEDTMPDTGAFTYDLN